MLLIGTIGFRVISDDRVMLEGTLREGSLHCTDACHFELVVAEPERDTRVRVQECIMPDALRDWPGRRLRLMVAGHRQGDVLVASSLLTRDGYAKDPPHTPGRPPECFIPNPR
jgi:hypothetical protein